MFLGCTMVTLRSETLWYEYTQIERPRDSCGFIEKDKDGSNYGGNMGGKQSGGRKSSGFGRYLVLGSGGNEFGCSCGGCGHGCGRDCNRSYDFNLKRRDVNVNKAITQQEVKSEK